MEKSPLPMRFFEGLSGALCNFNNAVIFRQRGEQAVLGILQISFFLWIVISVGGIYAAKFFFGEVEPILTIDRATIIFLFVSALMLNLLQVLDWWRRDLTNGSFILSRNIGTERLKVHYSEMAAYWFVPGFISLSFGLRASATLFFFQGVTSLIFLNWLWWKTRVELLNQRDGEMIEAYLSNPEKKIIGLQGSLRMAGVSGSGAMQHQYQNIK